jgi:hypothetical protein
MYAILRRLRPAGAAVPCAVPADDLAADVSSAAVWDLAPIARPLGRALDRGTASEGTALDSCPPAPQNAGTRLEHAMVDAYEAE